jgi:hypothetical protein
MAQIQFVEVFIESILGDTRLIRLQYRGVLDCSTLVTVTSAPIRIGDVGINL